MLAAGKNVVNTSFVPLLYPPAAGPGVQERLEAACQLGGTTLYTSGIDPGYGNAGATIGALALCREVSSIRMAEIVNYATWDNPFTMFEIMGFGKKSPAESLLLATGSTALAWGPVIELVAAALDVRIDAHHRVARDIGSPTNLLPSPRGLSKPAASRPCGSRSGAWSAARPASSSST